MTDATYQNVEACRWLAARGTPQDNWPQMVYTDVADGDQDYDEDAGLRWCKSEPTQPLGFCDCGYRFQCDCRVPAEYVAALTPENALKELERLKIIEWYTCDSRDELTWCCSYKGDAIEAETLEQLVRQIIWLESGE